MEFKDNQAIYLQIADVFCENILLKKWKGGERIPSVREMAVRMEVNPNTAIRTYNYLQEKGVIYNKRGIGYFVAENGYERTLEIKKQAFIEKEIPAFFKNMKMLMLSIEEIEKMYQSNNSNH
jgi:GntR family transcriptional regulator